MQKKNYLEEKHLMSSFEINTKIISRQENSFVKENKKKKDFLKIT